MIKLYFIAYVFDMSINYFVISLLTVLSIIFELFCHLNLHFYYSIERIRFKFIAHIPRIVLIYDLCIHLYNIHCFVRIS